MLAMPMDDRLEVFADHSEEVVVATLRKLACLEPSAKNKGVVDDPSTALSHTAAIDVPVRRGGATIHESLFHPHNTAADVERCFASSGYRGQLLVEMPTLSGRPVVPPPPATLERLCELGEVVYVSQHGPQILQHARGLLAAMHPRAGWLLRLIPVVGEGGRPTPFVWVVCGLVLIELAALLLWRWPGSARTWAGVTVYAVTKLWCLLSSAPDSWKQVDQQIGSAIKEQQDRLLANVTGGEC